LLRTAAVTSPLAAKLLGAQGEWWASIKSLVR